MQVIQWDGPQCTWKKWVVMVEMFISVTERRGEAFLLFSGILGCLFYTEAFYDHLKFLLASICLPKCMN